MVRQIAVADAGQPNASRIKYEARISLIFVFKPKSIIIQFSFSNSNSQDHFCAIHSVEVWIVLMLAKHLERGILSLKYIRINQSENALGSKWNKNLPNKSRFLSRMKLCINVSTDYSEQYLYIYTKGCLWVMTSPSDRTLYHVSGSRLMSFDSLIHFSHSFSYIFLETSSFHSSVLRLVHKLWFELNPFNAAAHHQRATDDNTHLFIN